MRAFQVDEIGQPPRLVDLPDPKPGPAQVTVGIEACGLNFADLLMIKGKYQDMPPAPFTLGMELAGTVRDCGSQVSTLKKGDRVAVFGGQGGLAERGVFDADRCVKLDDRISSQDAAALQIAYGTSHVALDYRAKLHAGETLLVTGASGGVGLTAVEIGKLMGARVIAVARGEEKLEVARRAGADLLIDAEAPDIRTKLKDLGGVDVFYDAVGGDVFREAFRACNPEARILAIGFASGDVPQIPANHLLVKNISVIGFYWGGYLTFKPQVVTSSLQTLLGWLAEGRIAPHISHVLPLDRAAEGLELLRTRQSTGKVIITPNAASA